MNIKPPVKHALLSLFLLMTLSVSAQKKGRAHLDSLLRQLPAAVKEDTGKVNLMARIGSNYTNTESPDSGFFYLQRALLLAEKLKWQKGIMKSYDYLGNYFCYIKKHDYVKATYYLKQAAELSFKTGDYPFTFTSIYDFYWVMAAQKRFPEEISYLNSWLKRFEKTGDRQEQAKIIMQIADCYSNLHNYTSAIEYYDRGLAMEETDHRKYFGKGRIIDIADLYTRMHYTNKARPLLFKVITTFEKTHDWYMVSLGYLFLASCDDADHHYAAAIATAAKAIQAAQKADYIWVQMGAETEMGWDYLLMKDYENAYTHTQRGITLAKAQQDSSSLASSLANLGIIYANAPEAVLKRAGIKPGQRYAKAISLLNWAINSDKKHNRYSENLYNNVKELSLVYEKMNRFDDALKAYKDYVVEKNKTDSISNEKAFALKEAQIAYSHKEDALKYKQEATSAQLKQKKQQSYFFIGGIIILLMLSLFIWLNFNNQRKSNKLLAEANGQLSEQREEITAQRDQLEDTLINLKTAQTQLIQSEKMASLGELTAGIAHEIQNPLNFVNNFSDVSRELMEELNEELDKGNVVEAKVISKDVIENLGKINHHGKRADGIVKGMLEHSRASTGQKEPTDINKLADEYLRLAYHGLRAKDKNFNAELVTHFENNLPAINMIPQDMGRVLLNLFNNAFYAVQQKKKIADKSYKPEVSITTLRVNNDLSIIIRDNGSGIPDAIKEKIMQPFFTTKPTGEGTGLGLSLSYDIVVKGHRGIINVNSKEGEGSEFIIQLPVSN